MDFDCWIANCSMIGAFANLVDSSVSISSYAVRFAQRLVFSSISLLSSNRILKTVVLS